MKSTKHIIHIVRHKATGAEVPVIVRKMSEDNIIEDYYEFTEKRKGFTLEMLQNRWDKTREDVLDLIRKYEIPAHIKHDHVKSLAHDKFPVDAAFIFEEYIYGLEKKEKLSHNKLKSKSLDNQTEH